MNNYVSPWMDEDLSIFRDAAARFLEAEMVPNEAQWRKQQHVGKDIWLKAGAMGLLCTDVSAEYGGSPECSSMIAFPKVTAGTLDTVTASMAKYWITDTQQEVLDECVQLHGGYGYMNEYLVCRMFVDSRVQRIYGGTNEIMKELISRAL